MDIAEHDELVISSSPIAIFSRGLETRPSATNEIAHKSDARPRSTSLEAAQADVCSETATMQLVTPDHSQHILDNSQFAGREQNLARRRRELPQVRALHPASSGTRR